MARLALLFPIALAAAAASADAQLVSQGVVGAYRICTYVNPNLSERRMAPEVRRRIGRGEPCPARYRGGETGTPSAIPSMATLVQVRRVGDQRVCVYEHLERTYLRPVQPSQACPRTPHFFN